MRKMLCAFLYLAVNMVSAQVVDPDLLLVKARMDSIIGFEANLELKLDVEFINMPAKYAVMKYEKGKMIDFDSEDFVMIPRKGLDFTLGELLKYPVITVDRGMEVVNGVSCKMINVIPDDRRADFSIAALLIDTARNRVMQSEITTRKHGTYLMEFKYRSNKDPLPEQIIVNFEIEKIRIPLSYMGKEADVDKERMKAEGPKTGSIILNMSDYQIDYLQ
ncbi:hypothetical protein [Robertkochia solimangrovi]|uniref:hypothetical protein n=1 Tax=Robertkochia solimangrovi TaxID=2213046 RepID=UPI00117C21AA|nr:hypothetical protein [Robertkochia solimangrovi]TRZ41821.1 hypothetical protein DMZ48_15865 [Robertkochia solimangrovi]